MKFKNVFLSVLVLVMILGVTSCKTDALLPDDGGRKMAGGRWEFTFTPVGTSKTAKEVMIVDLKISQFPETWDLVVVSWKETPVTVQNSAACYVIEVKGDTEKNMTLFADFEAPNTKALTVASGGNHKTTTAIGSGYYFTRDLAKTHFTFTARKL